MIRTVRSWPNGRLVSGRGGRLAGALLVLLLVAGVVVMHAMSGSATSHGAPHAAVTAAQYAAPDGSAPVTADAAERSDGCDTGSCGGHEMVTAMCLMVLAVLLTLVGPAARVVLRVEGPRGSPRRVLATVALPASGPSLHALGISRT